MDGGFGVDVLGSPSRVNVAHTRQSRSIGRLGDMRRDGAAYVREAPRKNAGSDLKRAQRLLGHANLRLLKPFGTEQSWIDGERPTETGTGVSTSHPGIRQRGGALPLVEADRRASQQRSQRKRYFASAVRLRVGPVRRASRDARVCVDCVSRLRDDYHRRRSPG